MNKIVTDPSLKLLFELLKKEIFSSLNCHAIGKIESFDTANQTAKISIAYDRRSIDDDEFASKKDYPLLIDCPCIVLSGGKGSIRFPITSGDFCLVFFNDRDIDSWFKNGGKTVLASDRRHSFSDAIALVGLAPLNKVLTGYDASKAQFMNDTTIISLGTKIEIKNAAKSLYTILDGVIGVLAALTTTNCVVGSPVAISPAQAAQLNVFKADLALLME